MSKNKKFKPDSKPKKRPKKDNTEEIAGIDSWSALDEYLMFAPEKIKKISVEERHLAAIKAAIKKAKVDRPIEIDLSLETRGFFATIDVRSSDELSFWNNVKSEPKNLILALDQVSDPRNLGAIARSAAFFGATWIVSTKNRQAPINNGALSSAQGAFALVKHVEVVNMARFLEELKNHEFWIFGGAMDGRPLQQFRQGYEKLALVLGNEGKGLRPLVAKTCDDLFSIEGSERRLESLNVSVAAGIATYHFSQANQL